MSKNEKLAILSLAAILTVSCKGQEHKKEENLQNDSTEQIAEQPKGTWKVDKEFDENGNLIRYDSIYSWSSTDDFVRKSILYLLTLGARP